MHVTYWLPLVAVAILGLKCKKGGYLSHKMGPERNASLDFNNVIKCHLKRNIQIPPWPDLVITPSFCSHEGFVLSAHLQEACSVLLMSFSHTEPTAVVLKQYI